MHTPADRTEAILAVVSDLSILDACIALEAARTRIIVQPIAVALEAHLVGAPPELVAQWQERLGVTACEARPEAS